MLENDVNYQQGKYEGTYIIQGCSDGMDYWVDTLGEHAIWYKSSGFTYYWVIADLKNLGTFTAVMYSSSNILEKKCPNNEGNVWNWIYSDFSNCK